jgi:DNA-binding transcriptional LysR family regulator
MEFRDFTYLQAIAQYKTISKAAQMLFISQPALTRFLQKLESDAGVPLFERVNKQMYPTFAGKAFLKAGREHAIIQRKLQNSLDQVKNELAGSFTIAITYTRGQYTLPVLLPLFLKKHPHYKIEILERPVDEVEQALESGLADLAIYSSPKRNKAFSYVHINQEEVILCMAHNNRHHTHVIHKKNFKYPWFDLSELKGGIFFVNDPMQWRIGQISQQILSEYHLNPRTTILRSLDTCLALVSKNLGYTFSFDICTTHFKDYETKPEFLSFGDAPILSEFFVAMRKNHRLTHAQNDFIELLKEHFGEKKQAD